MKKNPVRRARVARKATAARSVSTPKDGRGRPTKYEGEKTVAKVLQSAKRLLTCKGRKSFLRDWGLEQLAACLGVCRDTINEWTRAYPAFSDAIKTWTTCRNAAFFRMPGMLPNAIWIMGSKNILGWSDRQQIEGHLRHTHQLSMEDLTASLKQCDGDE